MAATAQEEKPGRPNRLLMKGMIWSGDHVLHLALKQETQTIPQKMFQDCKGILLLNTVEVGVLVNGSYGTGILLAKDSNGASWSPPCAMSMKSVGIGSLGTAVRDVLIFIFDVESLEKLASGSHGLQMEHPARATLGPLRRHETYTPQVNSKAIENYAAFSFTKGMFAGITGDFGSLSPVQEANEDFYKKKGVTPKEILFDGNVKVPKKKAEDTVLPDVYEKLDMLSKGMLYNGSEDKTEQAPMEAAAPRPTSATKSSSAKAMTNNGGASKQSSRKAATASPKPREPVTEKSNSTGAASAKRRVSNELEEFDC